MVPRGLTWSAPALLTRIEILCVGERSWAAVAIREALAGSRRSARILAVREPVCREWIFCVRVLMDLVLEGEV